ncbi:K-dependent Na :Ca2 antiporter [Ceraceosorus bombacis]|uniref:K-dependent Na: Ca2 antiporter n=1 Tax=Ceraceosorus bombacis TaxID=401625 RepID=A0A0P1BDA4_9BASI|nr:K-dependent Na :Ca2 antiporter [Ceraceosorus bombacis]
MWNASFGSSGSGVTSGGQGGTRPRRGWALVGLVLAVQLICWRGAKLSARSLDSRAANHLGYASTGSPAFEYPPLVKRQMLEGGAASQPQASYEQVRRLTNDAAAGYDSAKHHDKDHHHHHDGDNDKKHHTSSSHKSKHSTTSKHRSSSSSTNTKTTTTTSTTKSKEHKHSPTAEPPPHDPEPDPEPTPDPKPEPTAGVPGSDCHPIPLERGSTASCAHVIKSCPPRGHLDYLRFYYCAGVQSEALRHELEWSASDSRASTLHITGMGQKPEHAQTEAVDSKRPISAAVQASRTAALTLIIVWMLFLFSSVGIVASDFFCPNLSTLAARLGLNESTAGVTFLAFGNGSPDVFSTFGAMKSGSGSLAIGELIGAASFIVSVISGSMMLIAPFRVKAYPFIRDVGFFTVAVTMTVAFLFDGHLRFSECISLMSLYMLYAATVIIGSWFQERRRKQRAAIAAARGEYIQSSPSVHSSPFHISPERVSERATSEGMIRGHSMRSDLERTGNHLAVPGAGGSPYTSPLSLSEYDPDADPMDVWAQEVRNTGGTSTPTNLSRHASPHGSPRIGPSGAPSPGALSASASANLARSQARFRAGIAARHSLLGAVEFRDVVRSLQDAAAPDRSVEIFTSRDPERFLPHPAHQHATHRSIRPRPSRHARGVSMGASPMTALEGPAEGFSWNTRGDGSSSGRDRSNSTGAAQRPAPALNRSVSAIPSYGATSTSQNTLPSRRANNAQTKSWIRDTNANADVRPAPLDASVAVDDPWREGSSFVQQVGVPFPPHDGLHKRDTSGGSASHLDLPRIRTGAGRSRSPVPSIHVSSHGAAEESSLPKGASQSIEHSKSTLLGRSKDPTGAYSQVMKPRNFHRAFVRPLRRALFPSLRHFHEKSWLGVVVSLLTAPALLVLNLTLPVVDDDGASQVGDGEFDHSGEGAVHLEGDERPLQASAPFAEGEEERIIQLGATSISMGPEDDPWAARDREENRKRDLDVAKALKALPRGEQSLDDAASAATASVEGAHQGHGADTVTGDVEDVASECESFDSHKAVGFAGAPLLQTVAQCALAPPFSVWSVTDPRGKGQGWKILLALLIGLGLGVVVFLIGIRAKIHGGAWNSRQSILAAGMARCCLGFLVSVMWIMTIVDEVVTILQTVGVIMGLSDAILGLTVFAMGNSLGDLVANVTIARMGHPVMAISACFAGPLLNLLLGIGISGSYLLSGASASAAGPQWADGVYHIDFSPTLLVSSMGLLTILIGTLIAVPLNGFYLSRPLGWTLIGTYAVIMTTNILVEIFYNRKHSYGHLFI